MVRSRRPCGERLRCIVLGGMHHVAPNWRLHGFELDKICVGSIMRTCSTFPFLDFTTLLDIGRSTTMTFIVLTIIPLYRFILFTLQPLHPRCRMASAVPADRPPLASRSPPRRRMLPAAFALVVPRPLIPARAAARRALPLTRQRALVPHAVPQASKCRRTVTIAVARRAVLALTVPFALALHAALPPTLPIAHALPVPPRPTLLDAPAPLAQVFPNKRIVWVVGNDIDEEAIKRAVGNNFF